MSKRISKSSYFNIGLKKDRLSLIPIPKQQIKDYKFKTTFFLIVINYRSQPVTADPIIKIKTVKVLLNVYLTSLNVSDEQEKVLT